MAERRILVVGNAPAMLFHFFCSTCCSWSALRVRSLHGLKRIPPRPCETDGVPTIWKAPRYSGTDLPIASACAE